MKLQDLKKKIPYKWRVQSFSKKKPIAIIVAYIDSRDVQNLLDEVCGPENWQDNYKEVKGHVYAGVGIKIKDEWVWKWDCGVESKEDAEKGEASDSFKRAAVKWGVGRFLYSLEIKYLTSNEVKTKTNYPHVVDEKGNRVYDITKYVNNLNGKTPPKSESPETKWLAPGDKKLWNHAINKISTGETTIEEIKKKVKIRPEHEKQLKEAIQKLDLQPA